MLLLGRHYPEGNMRPYSQLTMLTRTKLFCFLPVLLNIKRLLFKIDFVQHLHHACQIHEGDHGELPGFLKYLILDLTFYHFIANQRIF